MTALPRPESVSSKLKADIHMWEGAWSKKFSFFMFLRLFFLEGGYQFVFWLRVVELMGKLPVLGPLLALLLQYTINIYFACDIARRCSLGGGLFVPHPNGIVIGADVEIGRNVLLSHQTTLGLARPYQHSAPKIGDGAYIACGAKILGAIVVGDGATVGANAVVLKDVPPFAAAVGVPARILTKPKQDPMTDEGNGK